MGVQTKLGIKPSQFGEAGPDDRLLPVEIGFYKALRSRVFVSSPRGEADTSEVWNAIRDFWEKACFAGEGHDLLHEQYCGIGTDDNRLLNDKESERFHIAGGLAFRSTLSIRIVGRACNIVGDTAFAIFNYAWEFTDAGSEILKREDGLYAQTWIRDEGMWKLLGSFGGPST